MPLLIFAAGVLAGLALPPLLRALADVLGAAFHD